MRSSVEPPHQAQENALTAFKQKGSPSEAFSIPTIKDWQAIAIICSAVFIYFRDIIFQQAYLWEDFLYYFYPVRNFAAISLAKGELPLWNPYTLNGMPFQADIQTGIFYIPNLLLTFFVSGERLNFYWLELEIIVHYAIAGVCMYYLAKHFGLQPIIALFSALVYCLSGFMIVHAIHQVVICQVAWFPLVILLFHKALKETAIMPMIIGGLVLGHAVLAGYPQMTLYIYLFLLLLFLFEFATSVVERGWKPSIHLIPVAAGMIVIALAVTAIQLLPTLELAPQSQRAEISYQKSQEGVLALSQLVTLVVPKYFGSSGAQGNTYWGPGVYWAFWETCTYVGIAGLICMIFAAFLIRSNKYVAFFFGIIVFSILFAIGDQFFLHKLFFYYVPGFSKFRNPGRIALLFSLAAALLGGFGLRYLLESGSRHLKNIRIVLVATLSIGGILTYAAFQGFLQPVHNRAMYEQIAPLTSGETKTAIILIVIVSAFMYALATRKMTIAVGVIAICAMQFIDMHIFGFKQNNDALNPAEYYDRPAQIISTLKEDYKSELTRINARQGNAMILDRNQGMVDRVFMMEGYTPLALQRYLPPGRSWEQICDLMNAKFRIHLDPEVQAMNITTAQTYLSRAQFVYNERVFKDEGSLRSFMESTAFDPAKIIALEEEGGLSLHDSLPHTGSKAVITSYSLGNITLDVTTPADGYLLLSEMYYPGWKAYIDGAEAKVLRADWCLRAIPVRSGSHQIDVRFEPDSFRRGMWITVGTLALCAGGMVYSINKKRKAVS